MEEIEIEIIEIEEELPENTKKTSNRLTRYEYTLLVAARALSLSSGAMPVIPYRELGIYEPREIAERELVERVIPLVVQRTLPDGTKEFWHVKDMLIKNY
jgi:DNA-directed RNA polymerase subunit K/omega